MRLRMLQVKNRNVSYKRREVIEKHHCAYVMPYLGYCVEACLPRYEDCWLLGRVKKRDTKMTNSSNILQILPKEIKFSFA